jgi:hypothetical protein
MDIRRHVVLSAVLSTTITFIVLPTETALYTDIY